LFAVTTKNGAGIESDSLGVCKVIALPGVGQPILTRFVNGAEHRHRGRWAEKVDVHAQFHGTGLESAYKVAVESEARNVLH
jgi:hypothetical protein